MNAKELALLGRALKALLKAGLTDDASEIVDYMAMIDKPLTEQADESGK